MKQSANSMCRIGAGVILRAALCVIPAWAMLPAATGQAAESHAYACAAPPAAARLDTALPRTAARLARGEPLTIVALGSSSTAGAGATSSAMSYPSRLALELGRLLPAQPVRVLNKGVNGEEIGNMTARFERDVIAERPDLVIWQLGTNSLLRHRDVARHAALLQKGIDRLRDAHIDVVLMDPQYAPEVLAVSAHSSMVKSIEAIAARNRIPVFHRFAVMNYWARTMDGGFSGMLAPDGLHMNDAGYGCLARLLAQSIVDAALGPGPDAVADRSGPRR